MSGIRVAYSGLISMLIGLISVITGLVFTLIVTWIFIFREKIYLFGKRLKKYSIYA